MNHLDTPQTSDPDVSRGLHARVFSDVTHQLYQAAIPGIVANGLLGIVIVWTLLGYISHPYAYSWLGANLTINFIRLFLTIYVEKTDCINEKSWKSWAKLHVVTTGLISLIWGVAAVLFYVNGMIEFQYFFTLILAGMISAALPIIGLYFPSYLAYTLPTILPLVVVFLTQDGTLHVQIAILLIIFTLTMVTTARRYYARIIESTSLRMQLDMLATIDTLTGLPNRQLFQDRLSRALLHNKRLDTRFALLFIDLDKFKIVNDTLGHAAGDQLLLEVSERIRQMVRESDTVARLGGDEFTVIVNDISNNDDIIRVAQLIIETLSEPFFLSEKEANIGASIGIAVFPDDAVEQATLMNKADSAMYQAKQSGRNKYCFFE